MNNIKSDKDFNAFIGLGALLFGLIYGIATLLLPRASIGNPMAPLKFPLILAGAMCILGFFLLIRSNFAKSVESFKKKSDAEEKMTNKQIIFTCIASIIYALLFDHLGYVISTFFFMEALLFLTNGKKWVTNTVVALVFSVGIYFIFATLLGISLPRMPFFYI